MFYFNSYTFLLNIRINIDDYLHKTVIDSNLK